MVWRSETTSLIVVCYLEWSLNENDLTPGDANATSLDNSLIYCICYDEKHSMTCVSALYQSTQAVESVVSCYLRKDLRPRMRWWELKTNAAGYSTQQIGSSAR